MNSATLQILQFTIDMYKISLSTIFTFELSYIWIQGLIQVFCGFVWHIYFVLFQGIFTMIKSSWSNCFELIYVHWASSIQIWREIIWHCKVIIVFSIYALVSWILCCYNSAWRRSASAYYFFRGNRPSYRNVWHFERRFRMHKHFSHRT